MSQTENAQLKITLGQMSSAGAKPENQDFHGALIPDGEALTLKGIALAVADGISSSSKSAIASETAVKSLMLDYYSTPDTWTVKKSAHRVISATNAWLYSQNSTISDINSGLVCTFSALILKGREGHIFHIGDSRISRLSGQSLEILTEDHRVFNAQENGQLTRAMGIRSNLELDYQKVKLSIGDVFLLTTDGVHEFIQGRDVARAVENKDLNASAKELVNLALERGSKDNLTIQILRIEATGSHDFTPEMQDLPVPPMPKSGDIIDGLRVIRPIYQSARSYVFLVKDNKDKTYALKIPASEIAQHAPSLKRFMLEEWVMQRASSPHILRKETSPEPKSKSYILTEFVQGQTLRQWMIDNPKADIQKMRDIIAQIILALRAMHRREMIHQDLRPENIMIDEMGTIKIIDFGAVAVAGVEEAAAGLLGEMPGTFQYTAPEYLTGDVVSWRSDQYALGVIAYEILTGKLPYGAQVARLQSRQEQMRLNYQSACNAQNNVPLWVDAALKKATHPDPIKRYDALSEFEADLTRPKSGWAGEKHIPLAQRNPVRFWQSLTAILAVICLILILVILQ